MSVTMQSILGATSFGVLTTAFLLKVLEIVTRHGILLTAQCVARVTNELDTSGKPVYRYRIRIQNLESVAAEQSFGVEIRATTTRRLSSAEKTRAVLVLAGWKPYSLKSDTKSASCTEFIWHAMFPVLPAYDTWSFEVILPSDRVELSLKPEGVRKRQFFAPHFGQYFEPDAIAVLSTDSREPRLSGPSVFPRPVLALVLSLLAVSIYMLFAGLHGWHWSHENLRWGDAGFLGGEILFIWAGYGLMRRRVYPVIQGYRFATPPEHSSGDIG